MTAEAICSELARRWSAKRTGKEWTARCLCHQDEHASMDFHAEGERIVFTCRSGGCPSADLFAKAREQNPDLFRSEFDGGTSYEIRDADGRLVAVHVRYLKNGAKAYAWKRPGGAKGLGGIKTGDLPFYGVELLRATQGSVVVTEGEKAALAARAIGFNAVGTVTGAAGCPSDENLKPLLGRPVYLWPDADDAGRNHMQTIANRLAALGHREIMFLVPSDAKPKDDAADFKGTKAEALGCLRDDLPSSEDPQAKTPSGLDPTGLDDATLVAAQGRDIAEQGIKFVVDGIVPDYGMAGMLVAYTKVGKTTLGHALGAAASRGDAFIGRNTKKVRVLYIAAEDPPEYTAWVARHLVTEPGAMTFFRRGIILDSHGLAAIVGTIRTGKYGLVLIASWQAVIRGLVKDENDNAGAVMVVEQVKAAAREGGIPWLIDAHSGKSEDQGDDADPTKALRGASAAAGASDFLLSLRYADGSFGNLRRLSGKGRFVSLEPQTIRFDPETGVYESLGSTKNAASETTWRLIQETGALTSEPRSVDVIARASGLVAPEQSVNGAARRRVHEALRSREGVIKTQVKSRGGKGGTATRYSLEGEKDEVKDTQTATVLEFRKDGVPEDADE
jgi:hypothetical protein